MPTDIVDNETCRGAPWKSVFRNPGLVKICTKKTNNQIRLECMYRIKMQRKLPTGTVDNETSQDTPWKSVFRNPELTKICKIINKRIRLKIHALN